MMSGRLEVMKLKLMSMVSTQALGMVVAQRMAEAQEYELSYK